MFAPTPATLLKQTGLLSNTGPIHRSSPLRKDCRFDANLHLIMGGGRCSEDGQGIVTQILEQLGTKERCADGMPGLEATISGAGIPTVVTSGQRVCRLILDDRTWRGIIH